MSEVKLLFVKSGPTSYVIVGFVLDDKSAGRGGKCCVNHLCKHGRFAANHRLTNSKPSVLPIAYDLSLARVSLQVSLTNQSQLQNCSYDPSHTNLTVKPMKVYSQISSNRKVSCEVEMTKANGLNPWAMCGILKNQFEIAICS